MLLWWTVTEDWRSNPPFVKDSLIPTHTLIMSPISSYWFLILQHSLEGFLKRSTKLHCGKYIYITVWLENGELRKLFITLFLVNTLFAKSVHYHQCENWTTNSDDYTEYKKMWTNNRPKYRKWQTGKVNSKFKTMILEVIQKNIKKRSKHTKFKTMTIMYCTVNEVSSPRWTYGPKSMFPSNRVHFYNTA